MSAPLTRRYNIVPARRHLELDNTPPVRTYDDGFAVLYELRDPTAWDWARRDALVQLRTKRNVRNDTDLSLFRSSPLIRNMVYRTHSCLAVHLANEAQGVLHLGTSGVAFFEPGLMMSAGEGDSMVYISMESTPSPVELGTIGGTWTHHLWQPGSIIHLKGLGIRNPVAGSILRVLGINVVERPRIPGVPPYFVPQGQRNMQMPPAPQPQDDDNDDEEEDVHHSRPLKFRRIPSTGPAPAQQPIATVPITLPAPIALPIPTYIGAPVFEVGQFGHGGPGVVIPGPPGPDTIAPASAIAEAQAAFSRQIASGSNAVEIHGPRPILPPPAASLLARLTLSETTPAPANVVAPPTRTHGPSPYPTGAAARAAARAHSRRCSPASRPSSAGGRSRRRGSGSGSGSDSDRSGV